MSGYTQLPQAERYQIYILKNAGQSRSRIAAMLGRHTATIGRELRRNQGVRGYRPQQAHTRALARRNDKARSRVDDRVWPQVDALLREAWSPEQGVSRLAMEQGIRLSHEWVYRHLYADKRSGGDLHGYVALSKAPAQALWGL